LAQHPRFATTDLRSLRAGSLIGVLPAESRPAPGTRANLLGTTESFGPYCGDRLDRPLPTGKEGSCGRPFPGVEVRIADLDTGAPVGADVAGEIQLRGSNLMRGICGRTRRETFTEDGFYPTGDLGRLDADGYLYLTGRRDDMFKVRGATVYPSEVEAALQTIAGVRRAFVVDVVHDEVAEVCAVVVVDPASALTVDDFAREARARLSSFKVPARWSVLDADHLPMTATGKPDKAALQQLFE
jgi:acyl-CoA synthetase (AMP-forming)/AMP-acid ligase II